MKPVMAAAAFLLLGAPTYAQVSVIQADYEEVITDRAGRVRFTEIGRHTFDETGQHRRDWTTRYGESVSEIVAPGRNERLAINHETRTVAVGPSNTWFAVPDLVQPRVTAADLVAGAMWATSRFLRLIVAELIPGTQCGIQAPSRSAIGVRQRGPVTLLGHRLALPGGLCRQPYTTERWTYAAEPTFRNRGSGGFRGITLERTTTFEVDGRPQVVRDKRLTAISRTTAGPGIFSAPAGYTTRNAFQP